jgi:hypothetical protein
MTEPHVTYLTQWEGNLLRTLRNGLRAEGAAPDVLRTLDGIVARVPDPRAVKLNFSLTEAQLRAALDVIGAEVSRRSSEAGHDVRDHLWEVERILDSELLGHEQDDGRNVYEDRAATTELESAS